MLGKLLKHEFKANAKNYVPIIIIFFVLAVMLRIMSIFIIDYDISTAFEVSYMFLQMIFVGGLYGLCIYAISGNVSRFNKNLFADEGYLMHTLPVPSYYHILTKIISGIIWFLIIIAAAAASLMTAFLGMEDFADIASSIVEIITTAFTEYPLDTLLAVILLTAIYSAFILLCYTATALSSFSSHKRQKTISVLISILALMLNNFLMYFVAEIIDNIDSSLEVGLIIYTLYFGLIAVGLFFGVNTIMSKHLNLE